MIATCPETRKNFIPSEHKTKGCDVPFRSLYTALDARKKFPDATLADLYDPLSMPPALVKAHAALDRAVDLCYRPQPFDNDRQRVEHLFALYEKLTAPLLPAAKKPRTRASRPRRPSARLTEA